MLKQSIGFASFSDFWPYSARRRDAGLNYEASRMTEGTSPFVSDRLEDCLRLGHRNPQSTVATPNFGNVSSLYVIYFWSFLSRLSGRTYF
jgi:hypothetical protein